MTGPPMVSATRQPPDSLAYPGYRQISYRSAVQDAGCQVANRSSREGIEVADRGILSGTRHL